MTDRDSMPPVGPGDVLAGKYRVERVLGAGGMGVVVAATHLELRDKVAVKFLREEALESEEAAARFVREARAAVRIKSEHVARVIDVGRLESGAPYMVMEYLEGHDLSERSGVLSIEDAVDYVIQACDAMAEAHAAGIIHRDLKPANLFLTQRSDGAAVVKVLDFGISKMTLPEVSEAGLTRTSTAMGSPLYMSPEQMRSAKDVDLRTDVWALGAILFELLAGATPFTGNSFPELCASILSAPPRPLRELRPEVPEALEAVVARCLAKEATDRYASVADLAAALMPFAPRRSRQLVERARNVLTRAGIASEIDIEIPVSVAETRLEGPSRTKTAWAETAPEADSKPRAFIWLALAGILALGGIGVAVVVSRSTPPATPEPSATVVTAAPTPAPEPTPSAAPTPSVAPAVEEEAGAPAVESAPKPKIAAPKPAPKPTA
ncbi:MAG: protein kinase, partial [Myxococcales bacterium]|nr:protein kinase [Myxococcales bacterium]